MPSPPSPRPDNVAPAGGITRRVLITAGPTQEPIDAVRFIGNRSSGRLGVALADTACRRGHTVTLLLGPVALTPTDSRVRVRRFRTTADLETLLGEELGKADVLVMAAAVADYRPGPEAGAAGKWRRGSGTVTLELEPTPDLLAACGDRRRSGQVLVGFALEPRDRLEASARDKLARKKVDLVVANPLETMDSPTIEATVFGRAGTGLEAGRATAGAIDKEAFAPWLLDIVDGVFAARGGG